MRKKKNETGSIWAGKFYFQLKGCMLKWQDYFHYAKVFMYKFIGLQNNMLLLWWRLLSILRFLFCEKWLTSVNVANLRRSDTFLWSCAAVITTSSSCHHHMLIVYISSEACCSTDLYVISHVLKYVKPIIEYTVHLTYSY